MNASVCVPAWNEEKTIGPMIESVLAQRWDGDLEVIVCANGCTDGTAAAAGRSTGRWPVRVLELPERGKPAAFNQLLAEATHDLQFFADGDVRIDPDGLSRLAQRLEREPRLVALGALSVPSLERTDWLTRVLNPAPVDHSSLVGRLYALRRPAVRACLSRAGFTGIPEDIVHEDLWLTVLVGPFGWATETGARAFYQPYHWSELLRIERRSVRAEHQILRDLGPLVAGQRDDRLFLNESRGRRWDRRRARLRRARGIGELVAIAVNSLVRSAIRRIAEVQVRREAPRKGVEGWEHAPRSKRAMPQSVSNSRTRDAPRRDASSTRRGEEST